jgi:4-oxalomesaconate hydratase
MEAETRTAPLRILHTAAHPADSFDMVGGTLAHHIERGDQVTVLSFTHGVRSHALTLIEAVRHDGAKADVDQMLGEKEREVINACAILGIRDVRFLRQDDNLLLPNRDNIAAVARVIRDVRPHVIITHSPFDTFGVRGAHAACCEITLLARAMAHGLMEGETSAPHTPGEIFFMWQHGESTLLDFVVPRFPQIIIDITDVIERKVRALDCLKTQFYPGPMARKVLEVCAATHTLHMSVPYGETFLRYYPQVEYYLPISEHNLRIVSDPFHKTYDRLGKMIAPFVPFDAKEA